MSIKLHLGCGALIKEGYINIDLFHPDADEKRDACDMTGFVDNSVDEIYSHHFLEHLAYQQAEKAFKEWFRVLKPGGLLVTECPNILWYCQRFLDDPEQRWRGVPPGKDGAGPYGHALIQGIFGGQTGAPTPDLYGFGSLQQLSQTHKSGWTPAYLIVWLRKVGFARFEDKSGENEVRLSAWK